MRRCIYDVYIAKTNELRASCDEKGGRAGIASPLFFAWAYILLVHARKFIPANSSTIKSMRGASSGCVTRVDFRYDIR